MVAVFPRFVVNTPNKHVKWIPHLIAMSSNAHQEVVRFDVSVDEIPVVNVFYSSNHLENETHTHFIKKCLG